MQNCVSLRDVWQGWPLHSTGQQRGGLAKPASSLPWEADLRRILNPNPAHGRLTCDAGHVGRLGRAHALELHAGPLLDEGEEALLVAPVQRDADAGAPSPPRPTCSRRRQWVLRLLAWHTVIFLPQQERVIDLTPRLQTVRPKAACLPALHEDEADCTAQACGRRVASRDSVAPCLICECSFRGLWSGPSGRQARLR